MQRSMADVGFCECWAWSFQVSRGAIVEDAQIVSVGESLNEVTSVITVEITPWVDVGIQVSGDQNLPILASN